MVFNKLLEQQVELMKKIRPAGSAALPVSNGSHNFSGMATPLLSCFYLFRYVYLPTLIMQLLLLLF